MEFESQMKLTNVTFRAALFAITLAATNSAKADTMSSAELRKLVPGRYHVSVADNVKIDVRLARGGAISATTDKGDHDTGRWSIVNDKMCVIFKRWLDHQKHCQDITAEGNILRGNGFTIRR